MLHVGTVLSVMHQDIIPRLILIRMAEAEDLPDRVSLLIPAQPRCKIRVCFREHRSDPMNDELQEQLAGVVIGDPSSLGDRARKILSNVNIFGVDLYEAGIGEQIEDILREELKGPGAVRKVLESYL